MEANVYYNPERFELEIVAQESQENMSYEYNDFVVWKHKDGRIFCAQDSGCSCPIPFENFEGVKDLTLLESLADLEREFNNWRNDIYSPSDRPNPLDLIMKCSNLFKGK